jgi:hypothetical protein
MKYFHAIIVSLILSLLLTFSAMAQQETPAGEPEVWGGAHVSLVMSRANATLEFDCAQGVIMSPIQPDAHGNFVAAGTFTPQHGGPVQKDSPPQDLPATYKGSIHGNTMQLQIVLQNKDQGLPAMTLTKGQAGHLVKCR